MNGYADLPSGPCVANSLHNHSIVFKSRAGAESLHQPEVSIHMVGERRYLILRGSAGEGRINDQLIRQVSINGGTSREIFQERPGDVSADLQ